MVENIYISTSKFLNYHLIAKVFDEFVNKVELLEHELFFMKNIDIRHGLKRRRKKNLFSRVFRECISINMSDVAH